MKDSIKVSILVPIYGVEDYIGRCAKSLFEQTYENIEYVFVDDCSVDNSISVLMSVMEDFPERRNSCKIIHNQNNYGISHTRNVLLRNATGNYVVWVDSDDWIEEDMIDNLVSCVDDMNVDVVLCGIRVVFSKNSLQIMPNQSNCSKDILISMLEKKDRSNIAAKMWKRTLYVDNDIAFPEGYNSGEDSYVNLKLMYYARCVKSIPLCLYNYDCSRSGSATDNRGWNVNRYENGWRLFDLIRSFFCEKGNEYVEALKVWEIKSASGCIVNCMANNCSRQLYHRIFIEHVNNIDRKYWRKVPLFKRFPLYLKNYYLVKAYILWMRWGKHTLLKKNIR